MTSFIAFITITFTVVIMASAHHHDGTLNRDERSIRDGNSGSGHSGYPRIQEGLGGNHNQAGHNQGGYHQGGNYQGGYPQGGHNQGAHQQGHGNHGGYKSHGY